MQLLVYILIEGEFLNKMYGKDKWKMCFDCDASPQPVAYHHINYHQ